ncbi:uncharacterized protein LOC129592057 [Paramacrobiotus metropolitanus]|uniref:uncharacterized protein LOC129592057 n=1 Tax=Paramacrobiotus metropolitanus TaxID=2943436 RepID=UPI0024461FDF|nr:uncharacterized protein LOC129592057 [Paramacrobiotus metropolitanus]
MAAVRDSEAGKIFIGGLSYNTTDESLTNYFIRFGEIKDSVVMKERDGKPRGFGFITYADPNSAEVVLSSPTGSHVIDGKAVDVKRCVSREEAPPPSGKYSQGFGDGFGGRGGRGGRGGFGADRGGRGAMRGGFVGATNGAGGGRDKSTLNKIFVGGLPAECTEADLAAAFQMYGNVKDTIVMMDQSTGRSKGFGFVTFDSDDGVERSCREHYVTILNKKVECKRATAGGGAGDASPRGGFRGAVVADVAGPEEDTRTDTAGSLVMTSNNNGASRRIVSLHSTSSHRTNGDSNSGQDMGRPSRKLVILDIPATLDIILQQPREPDMEATKLPLSSTAILDIRSLDKLAATHRQLDTAIPRRPARLLAHKRRKPMQRRDIRPQQRLRQQQEQRVDEEAPRSTTHTDASRVVPASFHVNISSALLRKHSSLFCFTRGGWAEFLKGTYDMGLSGAHLFICDSAISFAFLFLLNVKY